MAVAELYTTVKNPLGVTRNYTYLPPHGKVIAAGATYTFNGDLRSHFLITNDQRKWNSFQSDLAAANLKIMSTPPPILQDITSGNDKAINLNTTLGVATPTWG